MKLLVRTSMIRVLFDVSMSLGRQLGQVGIDNHTLSGATRDWPLDATNHHRFHFKKLNLINALT